jgi:hypothetical protein
MAKSKYMTHVLCRFEDIKAWRQSGESERNIAKKLNVSWQTFNLYKREYPDFVDLLRHSKLKLINNLKTALWKEAIGYDYDEKERFIEKTPYMSKDENGNPIQKIKEKTKVRQVTKRARSQATLLIYALCNLCPEEFSRVDREAMKELEEELIVRQSIITDEKIKNAFNVLNPHIKEEEDK